jgi:hypothetical protein
MAIDKETRIKILKELPRNARVISLTEVYKNGKLVVKKQQAGFKIRNSYYGDYGHKKMFITVSFGAKNFWSLNPDELTCLQIITIEKLTS